MKSIEDFKSTEDYLSYLKIETAKASLCVLLTKDNWADYQTVCREAHKIGDAFIKTINLKK